MSIKNHNGKANEKDEEEALNPNLRIELNKEDTKKFIQLKKILGIKNKSDVIRFCLTFTYDNYPKFQL